MEAPEAIRRGVAIGIVSNGRGVPVEWAIALATQSWPLNVTLHYIHARGLETGDARNQVVEAALEAKVKYIWFVDDDTVPPSSACRKLIYELEQNSDVAACGGIYCDKQEPPSPLVFKEFGDGVFWNWKVGDVFEVKGIATGCLVIKASVFEKLSKPWFKTVSEVPEDGRANRLTMTDDIFFCQKLTTAGFRILAHGGVLPDHYDVNRNIIYRLPAQSYPVR